MTFTYRLDSSDTTEVAIAAIRLEVGDADTKRGVKPGGENYTDEEIVYLYGQEDSNIGRTAARICEQQSAAWSSVPRTMFGSLFDPRAIARNFRFQADNLRQQHGMTTAGSHSFSVSVKRTGSNGP